MVKLEDVTLLVRGAGGLDVHRARDSEVVRQEHKRRSLRRKEKKRDVNSKITGGTSKEAKNRQQDKTQQQI